MALSNAVTRWSEIGVSNRKKDDCRYKEERVFEETNTLHKEDGYLLAGSRRELNSLGQNDRISVEHGRGSK